MIIIDIREIIYFHFLKTVFGFLNPIKKTIIKTECKVHKSINLNALNMLKNDKYLAEFDFFNDYMIHINEGSIWADQDFKSSNHFYNPYKKIGLYGRNSAIELGVDYYYKSIIFWHEKDFKKSLFYLGASLHIIQDMTIPQHANIRLLDDHRQFETFVKNTYKHVDDFKTEKGTYLLNSVKAYIRLNARIAIKIYKRYSKIKEDENRFFCISKCCLPLAERTTAGAMAMFYRDIFS